MAELSHMQQKIYDYIAACIREQGYPPSVREIGEAVGLKSPSTVHFHLKHLEEAGVIEKGAGKGRAIALTTPEVPEDRVPIVGNVAAGSPILAEECIEDYLTFDTGGRSGEYFALRVRGESMLNPAGRPGDRTPPGHLQQRRDRGGYDRGRGYSQALFQAERPYLAAAGE